jgi:hypothetical protein
MGLPDCPGAGRLLRGTRRAHAGDLCIPHGRTPGFFATRNPSAGVSSVTPRRVLVRDRGDDDGSDAGGGPGTFTGWMRCRRGIERF